MRTVSAVGRPEKEKIDVHMVSALGQPGGESGVVWCVFNAHWKR
jgi:hypothetical protein